MTPDLEISYTGRLETSYKGTQPPTEVGTYSVIFRVADTDPKYIGRLAVNFEITKAQGLAGIGDGHARHAAEDHRLFVAGYDLKGVGEVLVVIGADRDSHRAHLLRPQLPEGASWENVTYELTSVSFTETGYYTAGTAEIIQGPTTHRYRQPFMPLVVLPVV